MMRKLKVCYCKFFRVFKKEKKLLQFDGMHKIFVTLIHLTLGLINDYYNHISIPVAIFSELVISLKEKENLQISSTLYFLTCHRGNV